MNPVWRSERTVDFNGNSSKIPRWCHPKVTPRLGSNSPSRCIVTDDIVTPQFPAASTPTSARLPPPIYTEEELISICEPPSLNEKALQAVWKAKQDRLNVNDKLRETVAHADFVKQGLKEVKEKIECISRQLESPVSVDAFLEFAGESEVENPEELVAKHNRQLQEELLRAVIEEDKLTQELENAHRRLWEAGVEDNALIVEVENEWNPVIEAYDTRQEFMAQKRTFREKHIKQAAKFRRSKTYKIAKTTLLESSAAIMRRKNQIAQNAIGAKEARKRIEHHLKKSMKIRKDQKLLQACDNQVRQHKQHKSLSHLKAEIDEHRSLIRAQNQARENRMKRIEEEKDQIRKEFVRNGKNPYFVEHLLLIEERRTAAQRKILQQEAERLIQLQKDYEASERVKYRDEYHKQKWDRYWAEKFAEKKRERLKKETEFFLRDEFSLMAAGKSQADDRTGKESSTLDKSICIEEKFVSKKQDVVKQKSKSMDKSMSRRSRKSLSKKADQGEELFGDAMDEGLEADKQYGEFKGEPQGLFNERGDERQEKCVSGNTVELTKPKMIGIKKAGARPSFRCQPPVLTFSDFEVGKIYKKTLTITNISTQRLKVSLKEFIDSTVDVDPLTESNNNHPEPDAAELRNTPIDKLIKAKNQVSKTLSPGLTHEVYLDFTPQSPSDVSGHLVFDSAVESFQVRVECLTKRFIPELLPSKAVFTNVISTTSAFMVVKVVNKGAKPGILQHLEQNGAVSSYFENGLQSSQAEITGQKDIDTHNNPIRNILEELVNNVTDGIFLSYFKECNRQIGAHETRNLVIFFRPPSIDTYRTRFELQFDDAQMNNLILDVEGTSVENPIFINPMTSNLKICMMDNSYQQILTLSTSIRGAGKVVPQVPSELRHFVQVYPKKASLFAKNPAKFTVKFLPRAAILQNHSPARRYIDRDMNILDFPVLFHLTFPVKVQSPVSATIMAVLTNQQLVAIPEEIDMGKCSLTETVTSSFDIVNNCMLPQEIGFVGLPPSIMIQPNYGFATLLPLERRQFDILLSLPADTATGDLTFSLKLQTLQQREYFLKVRAFAKSNPVHLSNSTILFPPTAVGSDACATIEIFSEEQRMVPSKFEFDIDPEFPIQITPRAGHLKKGMRMKLFVEFRATLSETQVQQHLTKLLEIEYVHNQATLQRELEGINQTLKNDMVLEDDLNPEFKGTTRTNKTPNRRKSDIGVDSPKNNNSKTDQTKKGSGSNKKLSRGKSAPSETNAGDDKKRIVQEAYKALEGRRQEVQSLLGTPFQPPDNVHSEDYFRAKHDLMKRMTTTSQQYSIPCFVTSPDGEVNVLTLNIKGVVSAPSLIVLEESSSIDFSAVRGGLCYRQIRLYNTSSSTVKLKVDLLNPLGPFLLCNALRNIPPDHIFALKFRFAPKESKSFSETIGVSGGGSHFNFSLNGSCTA